MIKYKTAEAELIKGVIYDKHLPDKDYRILAIEYEGKRRTFRIPIDIAKKLATRIIEMELWEK